MEHTTYCLTWYNFIIQEDLKYDERKEKAEHICRENDFTLINEHIWKESAMETWKGVKHSTTETHIWKQEQKKGRK